jgi:predicted Zn-dependent protease
MRKAVAIALTFGALAGCAPLPPAEVDRELGKETAQAVEEQIGLVDDRALSAYLSAVGERVIAALPNRRFDYRFAVVDQAEPNAFASPGGYVYVSRGLLALARSEDELAGVIAHEVQHVERRHSVQQMQKEARLGLLALPGVLVTGIVSTDLANLVVKPFEAAAASYSRDQEREADALAQPIAAAAGYDPAAIVAILARMERFIETVTHERRAPGFFDSHPSTPERVAALSQRAKSLQPATRPAIAGDGAAFIKRLDGLVYGDSAAEGVLRGTDLLHADLDFRISFPKGWTVDNTRTALMAVAPGKDGVAAFGLAGNGDAKSLPGIAEEFAAKLEREYRQKPEHLGGTTAAGLPAQAVYVTDSSGKEPVHLYFLWIADRGRIYQLIGITPHSQRELVRAVVESLRPLSSGERASITELRLRVVPAHAGEDLATVSRRAGGVLELPTLAAINGVDLSRKFPAGEPVKVIARVPYRASSQPTR